MSLRVCAVALVMTVSLVPTSVAQVASEATTRLIGDARAGTARYENVNAAIADGFKRVGVEFPAMGEHWVSLPRILENRFDAGRPSVLIYITTHGKRQLAGVGYTALLGDGEQPPRTAARLSDWHEHNGSVVDESLPVHGHESQSSLPAEASALGATRLAILHVWAWTKNPAGPFVTENWTLPMIRFGGSPRKLQSAALRAMSLGLDSASYYEQTLSTSLQLTAAESQRVRAIVGRHRAAAQAELARRATPDEDALRAIWTYLWADLERGLPTHASDLRALRAKL